MQDQMGEISQNTEDNYKLIKTMKEKRLGRRSQRPKLQQQETKGRDKKKAIVKAIREGPFPGSKTDLRLQTKWFTKFLA